MQDDLFQNLGYPEYNNPACKMTSFKIFGYPEYM